MLTLPNKILNNTIDGYFAAFFEKTLMILLIKKFIFLYFISKFRSRKNLLFTDLNFKKIDFTNYHQIKSFIFKKRFL